MLKAIKNNTFLFNLLKLLGAVIILYLGLKLSVYYIGDKQDLTQDKLYDTELKSVVDFDEDWKEMFGKHEVASLEQEDSVDKLEDLNGEQNEYQMKFQSMCLSNMSFCAKVKFQGDFSQRDKYMYLATSIYVLKHIENNLQFARDIKTQAKRITINNEIGTRRGFANWETVTINLGLVLSYVEFLELLTHELGHVVDLGLVRGISSTKSTIYTEFNRSVLEIDDPSIEFYKLSWQSEKVRNSVAVKEDFCSGYGMTNPFEDFAECHNLYLNHNAIFRAWSQENETMKRKYNFMANLYGGSYLFDSSNDLSRFQQNKNWRPWDTTRM